MDPKVNKQIELLDAKRFSKVDQSDRVSGVEADDTLNDEALENMKHDAVWKVIIIGDTGVGKSCMIAKLIHGVFRGEHNVTIGVEFGNYGLVVKKQDGSENAIKLQIWDTAGQESFRSITRIFYKGSQAVVIVFDMTQRETFEQVRTWQTEIENNTDEDVLIYLVANFADMADQRVVSTEEAIDLCKELGFHNYMEVSAFTGNNIEALFETLTKHLFINHEANLQKYKIDDDHTDRRSLVRLEEPDAIKLDQSGRRSMAQEQQKKDKKCC